MLNDTGSVLKIVNIFANLKPLNVCSFKKRAIFNPSNKSIYIKSVKVKYLLKESNARYVLVKGFRIIKFIAVSILLGMICPLSSLGTSKSARPSPKSVRRPPN